MSALHINVDISPAIFYAAIQETATAINKSALPNLKILKNINAHNAVITANI